MQKVERGEKVSAQRPLGFFFTKICCNLNNSPSRLGELLSLLFHLKSLFNSLSMHSSPRFKKHLYYFFVSLHFFFSIFFCRSIAWRVPFFFKYICRRRAAPKCCTASRSAFLVAATPALSPRFRVPCPFSKKPATLATCRPSPRSGSFLVSVLDVTKDEERGARMIREAYEKWVHSGKRCSWPRVFSVDMACPKDQERAFGLGRKAGE
jgi:hypothetical protein